jgi:hypothetical protein
MQMRNKTWLLIGMMSTGITLMNACSKKASEATASDDFDLIQQKILTPSCATPSCHSSTTDATYPQHGLVLAAGQGRWNEFGEIEQ